MAAVTFPQKTGPGYGLASASGRPYVSWISGDCTNVLGGRRKLCEGFFFLLLFVALFSSPFSLYHCSHPVYVTKTIRNVSREPRNRNESGISPGNHPGFSEMFYFDGHVTVTTTIPCTDAPTVETRTTGEDAQRKADEIRTHARTHARAGT